MSEHREEAKIDHTEEEKTDIVVSSMADEIDTFVQHLDALATSLPLVMSMMTRARTTAKDKQFKFLEAHGSVVREEGAQKTYNLSSEHIFEFNLLERKTESLNIGYSILPRSFIVSLVSQFDFFLGRMLRCLYYLRPELLSASEKNLSFSQLMSIGSIEAAKELVIEKEIESILRESHAEQFAWLEKKFDIALRKDLSVWPTFIELAERRNLFVHTNGVVSTQYINVCRQHSVKFEDKIISGHTLEAEPEYFKVAFQCIFEMGIKLAQVLWRKICPNDIKDADASINNTAYHLLVSNRYEIAITLLDFANLTLKKHSSNEKRRTLVINWAQAYKWSGDNDRCFNIVNKEDWSDCSDKFKIAVAVLLDKHEDAAALMASIGVQESFPEQVYKDWPLFKEFRKTEIFAQTFQQTFGHSFNQYKVTERADSSESHAEP